MALPQSVEHSEVPIPAQIRKNIWMQALAQAVTGAGTQLVPALGAIQVLALLGNATYSGITTSLMGLARMLMAFPMGRLTDRRGRKMGLYIGLWMALVGSLTIGLATLASSFVLFCLGALVFGGGVGTVQLMRIAAADMYPPSRRSEGMSLIQMGSLFGAGLSPLIVAAGGKLGHWWNVSEIAMAWLVVPVLVIPCFWLVYNVRPDPRQIAQNLSDYYPAWALESKSKAPVVEGKGLERVRIAAIAAAVSVQGQMVMLMAMTSLALKMQDCSLGQISLSVAIHVIGMFALSWPIGRLADRIGRKPVIMAGLVVAGLGALLVGLGHEYFTITSGTFLVGLSWSAGYLASNTIVTDVTPASQRGQAIGTLETWANLLGIFLPLLGGVIVQHFGLNVLGFCGIVLLLPAGVLMLGVREDRPGSYRV